MRNIYLTIVLLSISSCSFLEPDRQELIKNLNDSFIQKRTEIEKVKNYLLTEKNKREVDILLRIASRLGKVQLYERRVIVNEKKGWLIVNEDEYFVTKIFFSSFKTFNIGSAYTDGNQVKFRLLNSPSYEYEMFYVWSAEKEDENSFDWCSPIDDEQWLICGLKY